jgi:hypothetical protein
MSADLDSHIDNILSAREEESEPEQPAPEPDDQALQDIQTLSTPPQPSGVYSLEGVRYDDERQFADIDPIGHSQAWLAQQQAEINNMKSRESMREVMAHTAQQAEAVRQERPEYVHALESLMSSRKEELKGMGYSDAQANAAIEQESANLALQAYSQGANPAEWVLNIARARGFDAGGALETMSDKEFDRFWDSVEGSAKKSGYSRSIRNHR